MCENENVLPMLVLRLVRDMVIFAPAMVSLLGSKSLRELCLSSLVIVVAITPIMHEKCKSMRGLFGISMLCLSNIIFAPFFDAQTRWAEVFVALVCASKIELD